MDFIDTYLALETVSWLEATIRILLALMFGYVIGFDRDKKNKPIDFRAYMIVCAATCVVAMLAQELNAFYMDTDSDLLKIDLGKIIAGILTGIGFLGAGAIIKKEDTQVIGSATGASIWASGGIGLCLGFGIYALAVIAFAVTAMILIVGGYYMQIAHDQKDMEKQ